MTTLPTPSTPSTLSPAQAETEKLRTLLGLPMTREGYIAAYGNDPSVMALLSSLDKTYEKLTHVEVDAGKLAMIVQCFQDDGNWKANTIHGTANQHAVFTLGNGKIGSKLIQFLVSQMNLM